MERHSSNAKIALSWQRLGPSQTLLAYREDTQALVYPIVDYCIYLSKNLALDNKTVFNNMLYVKRFVEYLFEVRCEIDDVNDGVLESFRDAELICVLGRKNHSGSDQAAKRTVNAKLRRIYHFLNWYQEVEHKASHLIGAAGCKVSSTIGLRDSNVRKNERDAFPVTFRMVGEGTRHRVKYVATTRDVESLTVKFLARPDAIAQRNILMMDIACEVGMRRASINSLCVDQFVREKIDAVEGDWPIVPPVQKFGYENKFEMPFRLAYRICDYIDAIVIPTMEQRRWTAAHTQGRVFFSFKSGRPLRDQTLSQIFGKALDDLGIDQHGANIHGLRRKYANDEIIRELDRRLAQGLDTSVASVAASVSITLGHSNPESIEPYISGARARAARHAAADLSQDKLSRLEDENRALQSELSALRRKLREKKP